MNATHRLSAVGSDVTRRVVWAWTADYLRYGDVTRRVNQRGSAPILPHSYKKVSRVR